MINWYKIAKAQKKPYNIIKICGGKDTVVGSEIDAYSAEQARTLAFKQNSGLYDYLEIGCSIEARLNKPEWERRQRVEEETSRIKEEEIQEAWWQN